MSDNKVGRKIKYENYKFRMRKCVICKHILLFSFIKNRNHWNDKSLKA